MISIYKPNRKNEGCACSFMLSNDLDIFLNAVKQFSWDDAKRTGSFSENAKNKDKTANIKLNEWEIGGIIAAIDHQGSWSAYHSFEDNKSQISFKSYEKKDKEGKLTGEIGFGLSITRNSTDVFKLPIEQGEAQVIKYFLISCLNKIFAADEQKKKDSRPQQ